MSKKKLLKRIESLIGEKCVYDLGGEERGALLFDWDELPGVFRREFVAEIFGDCDVPGDFPAILEIDEGAPAWKKNSPWLPFALANVQDEDVELSAGDGFVDYPQFDQLLLVNLEEIEGSTIPVYSIDVDGTAIPAQAPELFADELSELDFR